MPSTITTLADLLKSAVTYQQQLVQMPAIGARCDLLTNSYLRSITNTTIGAT